MDGTITKAMIGIMHRMKHVCKNICLSILKVKVVVVFLGMFPLTFINKTDGKDPKKRKNYWMRILKTYAPFGLNIEDNIWLVLRRSTNVTGGLTFLIFFRHIGWTRYGFRTRFFGHYIYFFVFIV